MSNITLPGLIDVHVHLREPGQTYKEDFNSGTRAALAGGFTTVLDMPNNTEPITTLEKLEEKIELARQKAVCNIGFHFGSLGDNLGEFNKVRDKVFGLKLYLNVTTGGFIIDKAKLLEIYKAWDAPKPVLVHSEDEMFSEVLKVVAETKQPTHLCHLSTAYELQEVMRAKDQGLPVTCGVTPHHLFMNEEDAKRLGPFAHMKPQLKPQSDVDFLWQNLDAIDLIESDHAPHTLEEKQGDSPPFGVPGLETTLSLLLTAEKEGKLTREKLLDLCHNRPASIFGITDNSQIEVSLEDRQIANEELQTKAGWSPFHGQIVVGSVQKVTLDSTVVLEDGNIVARSGSGRVLTSSAV